MAIGSLQLPSSQAVSGGIDWTPLSQLGQVYKKAQNEYKLSELGKGLADGSIDYKTAAGQVADMGDVTHTLQFLALAEQQKKQADELQASRDFPAGLASIYGAAPNPAAAAPSSIPVPGATAPAAPASVAPRAPVQPTSKVWGDDEAVAAGIYDQPTQVAQATGGTAPALTAPVAPVSATAPAAPAASAAPTPSSPNGALPSGLTPRAIQLIALSSNPRQPQGNRETAKTLLTAELDNSKATPEMKEWAFAKSQDPKTPDYTTWIRANKSAGKTDVNIDTQGKAFEKAAGGSIAKRFEDLSKEGDTATTDLALIGQLRDLGQVVKTGAPAAIQGWLADRGIKVGDNVGAVEAYGSIIDKLTPQQRIPGSGATSDYEGKMFKNSLQKLINTPEGNEIIGNTLAAIAQNKIDRAKIAEQGLAGDLTPSETMKQLRALPSPYSTFQNFAKNGFKADPNGPGQAAPPLQPAQQSTPQQKTQAAPVPNARQAADGNWYVEDPKRPGKYLQVQ